MTKQMNKERMEELAQWLEQGAPHIVFDMHTANADVDSLIGYLEGEEAADILTAPEETVLGRIRRMQAGDNQCGSVCCIAGYVSKLYGDEDQKVEDDWSRVGGFALDALGLENNSRRGMFHDLFDPHEAPVDCTPEMAAIAVRNVMAGKAAWEGIH